MASITEGNIFGELGLTLKKPRAATITCQTDCVFAVLEKKVFQGLLNQVYQKVLEKKTDFFTTYLFPNISQERVRKVAYHFKLRTVNNINPIFEERQPPRLLYFIKSGIVDIYKDIKMTNYDDDLATVNRATTTNWRPKDKSPLQVQFQPDRIVRFYVQPSKLPLFNTQITFTSSRS